MIFVINGTNVNFCCFATQPKRQKNCGYMCQLSSYIYIIYYTCRVVKFVFTQRNNKTSQHGFETQKCVCVCGTRTSQTTKKTKKMNARDANLSRTILSDILFSGTSLSPLSIDEAMNHTMFLLHWLGIGKHQIETLYLSNDLNLVLYLLLLMLPSSPEVLELLISTTHINFQAKMLEFVSLLAVMSKKHVYEFYERSATAKFAQKDSNRQTNNNNNTTNTDQQLFEALESPTAFVQKCSQVILNWFF